MRFSRPCYNKAHRCPGWAGGGNRTAKTTHCGGGSMPGMYDKRLWRFRFNRHDCGTVVLPYVVSYLDPTWWKSELKYRTVAVRYWWRTRKDRR